MSESDLLAVLARSGLSDADYADACAAVRGMEARIVAADRLAVSVLEAQHYVPVPVVNCLTAYLSFYEPVESDALAA